MSSQSVRKRLARSVRRLLSWSYTPYWLEPVLRRLAHRIHPHVLRCRCCGAEFIALDAMSTAHAVAAYEHFVANHRTTASAQGIGGRDQGSRTGRDIGHRKTSPHGGTSDSTPSARGPVRPDLHSHDSETGDNR